MSKTKARRRSSAERAAILSEFVESGRTQRDFCLEGGIALSTFQSWMRKAGEEDDETAGRRHQVPAFVEVQVAKAFPATALPRLEKVRAEYDLVLRGGQRLVVRSGFALEEVAALVDLLEAR